MGNIWIGRFDGLTRYDGKSFTDFLSNHLTYYIIEDKSGNIWLSHSEPKFLLSKLADAGFVQV
jgi:ligand-binding sensor domain-containing protein